MRPPDSDSAAPAIPARRLFLRHDIRQIPIGIGTVIRARTNPRFFGLRPRRQGLRAGFLLLRRNGRGRDEEVYASSLELRFRREDQNPANSDALSAWFAQNVVRVGLEDFSGGDRTGYFFYVAVKMDDSDQI